MKIFSICTSYCLLVGSFLAPGFGQQEISIGGHVFDAQTKLPLPFANITVLHTTRGTMSDASGYFNLHLPEGNHEVLFSVIGYQTSRIILECSKQQPLLPDVFLTPTVLLMPGVTILAHKPLETKQNESISSYAFETRKMKDLPFSLNDVYRSLKTLPGISSNNEKSSEFNVRGGSFEENLVQVDGVTIYRPFHLKEMPNASISILNMALMENVNLITGGFPAKYGDKMSAVLEIKYRQGTPDKIRSQLELGVVNSNMLLEGPLGQRCQWIVGFNKSHFEPSFKIMNRYFPQFLEGIDGIPKFYDVQGKIDVALSTQQQLSLLFLHSHDDYHEQPFDETQTGTVYFDTYYTNIQTMEISSFDAVYGNTLSALQFQSKPRPWLGYKAAVSYYDEREDLAVASDYTIRNKYFYRTNNAYCGFSHWNDIDQYRVDLKINTVELKNEVTVKITPYQEIETGCSYQSIKYLYDLYDRSERIAFNNVFNYPDTLKIDTLFYDDNYCDTQALSSNTYKWQGYLQDSWQVSDQLFVNFGMRVDYFDFNKNINWSPRASLSYSFGDYGLIKAAWGHYYQSPLYQELKYNEPRADNTKNQRAIHYILGYQKKILNLFEFKIDFYYKDYHELIPYYLRSGYKLSTQENNAHGFARGFDCQLKYMLGGFSGWLSYGYLVAKENAENDGRGFYPRSTDQRHSISTVLDWEINEKWRIFGKIQYGSGYPYTPFIFDRSIDRFVPEKINSAYLPPYKKCDIRISRYFRSSRFNWNIYVEVINLFNNKNIFTYENYDFDLAGRVTREAKRLLPLTPNIGVNLQF